MYGTNLNLPTIGTLPGLVFPKKQIDPLGILVSSPRLLWDIPVENPSAKAINEPFRAGLPPMLQNTRFYQLKTVKPIENDHHGLLDFVILLVKHRVLELLVKNKRKTAICAYVSSPQGVFQEIREADLQTKCETIVWNFVILQNVIEVTKFAGRWNPEIGFLVPSWRMTLCRMLDTHFRTWRNWMGGLHLCSRFVRFVMIRIPPDFEIPTKSCFCFLQRSWECDWEIEESVSDVQIDAKRRIQHSQSRPLRTTYSVGISTFCDLKIANCLWSKQVKKPSCMIEDSELFHCSTIECTLNPFPWQQNLACLPVDSIYFLPIKIKIEKSCHFLGGGGVWCIKIFCCMRFVKQWIYIPFSSSSPSPCNNHTSQQKQLGKYFQPTDDLFLNWSMIFHSVPARCSRLVRFRARSSVQEIRFQNFDRIGWDKILGLPWP